MPAFTLRLDEQLTADLDKLFPLLGFKSRNHFLEHLAIEAIKRGFIPSEAGEGYLVSTPNGGRFSLIQQNGFVSSGGNGLTDEENDVFQKARDLASQGQWFEARQLIELSGLQVEYIA